MIEETTIPIPLEIQVPLSQVQQIVRAYLLAQFAQRPAMNGAHATVPPQEAAAPVLPSLDASPGSALDVIQGQASAGAP